MNTGSSSPNPRPASESATASLAAYDDARFAMFLGGLARNEPLRGRAAYENDTELGNILRIELDGDMPGRPELIIEERQWGGLIAPDYQYGCDYCLIMVKQWSEEIHPARRGKPENLCDDSPKEGLPLDDNDIPERNVWRR